MKNTKPLLRLPSHILCAAQSFAITLSAIFLILTGNAVAAGGSGGQGSRGGVGGANSVSVSGVSGGTGAGSVGQDTSSGGGGGGGSGISGGNGGTGGGGIPGIGGIGGTGGVAFGASGGIGGSRDSVTSTGGGGGGGGGAAGTLVSTTSTNSGSISGGAGGAGGAGWSGSSGCCSYTAAGGGGGSGGYGAIVNSNITYTNSGIISGGNGGAGGNSTTNIYMSGAGGGGGIGVYVGNNANLINSNTINGGAGGSGLAGSGSVGPGVYVDSGSTSSITNTGTITGGGSGAYGIQNIGTVVVLNSSQGVGGALTYKGALPTNYNIIINSITSYGKLAVTSGTGNTSFGIYTGSITLIGHTYSSILSGITTTQLGGVGTTINGASNGFNYSLLETGLGTNIWNLNILSAVSPSTTDTQVSISNSAQKLRTKFNASASPTNFANMNTYDCNLFDTKGMCISAGGRYTTVDNPNSNSTSAVVVIGYKTTPNIRIGGFLDQNVNNNTPNGTKVSNRIPLMGVFAVWNQNTDGLGVQVKLANAYQDKDVNTTRDVIGTSEAGTGATNLNTQSYVGELSYAYLTNQDKTILRPYLALRQTTIKQDAYTETGVSTPLSYGSLKDRSTTALVGLKLNHALTPKATLTASLGIEQDLEHSVDQYSATSSSIANLTSENFNDSIKRTRPVASAGAYYAVSKTQRISGDVFYQQLPFQSTGSTTAYFSYMIGL